jgi:hypothetical protein
MKIKYIKRRFLTKHTLVENMGMIFKKLIFFRISHSCLFNQSLKKYIPTSTLPDSNISLIHLFS